jgi:carbonic anhydrase
MGHTHCGAVGAALHSHGGGVEPSLGKLVAEIQSAIGHEHDELAATKANVRNSAKRLLESDALNAKVNGGELTVLLAVYDIATGKVEFFQ